MSQNGAGRDAAVRHALVRAERIVGNIARKGLTIYDPIRVGDNDLWLPSPELEAILSGALAGLDVNYPNRTRSKIVKTAICEALGYPVPSSFTKTQPRFPGQNFDTYVQKSTNLQVWNEELSPTRRYVLIDVREDDVVRGVKVVTGDRLAELDTTGTLTQKYQARLPDRNEPVELLSPKDSPAVARILAATPSPGSFLPRSTDYPEPGRLLSVQEMFEKLQPLHGITFPDRGVTQDRNRGGDLHRVVCAMLGYSDFYDDGACPDIKNQLLEIKLQTASTIDLGLVCPNSDAPLDIPMVSDVQIAHRDLRYLVCGGAIKNGIVTISRVYLVVGSDFFSFFPQFGGRVLNKKLQIPLPKNFFTS